MEIKHLCDRPHSAVPGAIRTIMRVDDQGRGVGICVIYCIDCDSNGAFQFLWQ